MISFGEIVTNMPGSLMENTVQFSKSLFKTCFPSYLGMKPFSFTLRLIEDEHYTYQRIFFPDSGRN